MRFLFLSTMALCAVLVPLAGAQKALVLSGDTAMAHDPSIGAEGKNYYVFTTGHAPDGGEFAVRCSPDLTQWSLCGHVFDAIPEWIRKTSPETKELWAPDVSYFAGKYHLYYAYSAFGVNRSGIALATNVTLDPRDARYHWKDEGLVLRSTAGDDFNAIDPNIVFDAEGVPWLSFGSFWSGIKMRRIDAATGKLDGRDAMLYALAERAQPAQAEVIKPGLPPDSQAIEAPFIVHHGDYYYLFVSFDLCCRGLGSSYRTMVGRARVVTGPYVDAAGKPMLAGGGTQLLTANARWLGPGGASILQRKEGDVIVFHAYDAKTGKPGLQISTLRWEDGWPHAVLGTSGKSE
jgi:arabinan endo-1,5-alpha-L-arabinosidase